MGQFRNAWQRPLKNIGLRWLRKCTVEAAENRSRNRALLDILGLVRGKLSQLALGLGGCGLALALGGCKHVPAFPEPGQFVKQHHAEMDTARQQLELIPPPSKSRYLAVSTLSSWENPFITVQQDMLVLHVLQPDANPSTFDQGGLLRPVSARRQDLDLLLGDLPQALAAIPEEAWPYGRVVAVEEVHNIPKNQEPGVRRNVEATIKVLNELGVVVDEWPEPNVNSMH